MRILGLDVGSRNLGYSVCSFNDGDPDWLVLANSYYLSNPEIKDRLVFVESELSKLIHDYYIDVIAYEAPYMRNGKNAMGLYFVAGIITYLAGKFDLPLIALSPAAVKKTVTGTGKAEKKLVEKKVIEFLQPGTTDTISFRDDHSSDAAAICITGYKKHGNTSKK